MRAVINGMGIVIGHLFKAGPVYRAPYRCRKENHVLSTTVIWTRRGESRLRSASWSYVVAKQTQKRLLSIASLLLTGC